MTSRQRTLLEAFAAFEREHARAPSLRELLDALGRTGGSTNGVLQQLRALEAKGMMLGLAGVSRGWTMTAEGRAEIGAERRCPRCGEVIP